MAKVKDPLTPDFTLLGLLSQQPMHGYELYQRFHQTPLADIWSLGLSQMYAALKRLEEHHWVVAQPEWHDQSHPPRKVYRPTVEGEIAFQSWLTEPVASIREVRVHFLSKLYFASRQGAELAKTLLARQEAMCRSQLSRLQKNRHDMAQAADPIRQLVLDFRCGQIETILHWLEQCRFRLAPTPFFSGEAKDPL